MSCVSGLINALGLIPMLSSKWKFPVLPRAGRVTFTTQRFAVRVHREDDEWPSMGHTSAKSAKKGRILDLTYDNIQEEKIRISCTRDRRNVEYALECKPDYDLQQAVINAALNDQALDMDCRDKLDGSFISIDETS